MKNKSQAVIVFPSGPRIWEKSPLKNLCNKFHEKYNPQYISLGEAMINPYIIGPERILKRKYVEIHTLGMPYKELCEEVLKNKKYQTTQKLLSILCSNAWKNIQKKFKVSNNEVLLLDSCNPQITIADIPSKQCYDLIIWFNYAVYEKP